MTKQEMLCKIHAYQFSQHELVLFLDTHPDDSKALQALADFRKCTDEMIEEYESMYGPMNETVRTTSARNDTWEWVNDPWPWDYCAGKEC